ncbi:hypothetical protein Scep_002908 [Stephania cephalantha]|uniref:UPF3 domain-containing protein n=1 Tax=Stephania cephalantha TaxID=152367 RepID=A0AAP0LCF7_9MAGN
MKDPFDRTKVVLRHLPPGISQAALLDQINSRFSNRYRWFAFRPGKTSQSYQQYARAYIDFNGRDDVLEFAEFFDGRMFVNEKGAQFKCIVEYAPSQRVPKVSSKKDGREGTISKDPEYLEFLEFLAKPVEYLPSAEIQLERREAERAGAGKDSLIVTPLMDFIRQKRAAKSGTQRSSANGKLSRKAAGAAPSNSRSSSIKRGLEKRKGSTSMYVLRDSGKSSGGKDKATYILVPRREDQQLSDRSIATASRAGHEKIDDNSVPSADRPNGGEAEAISTGKKKILLLKGKEQGTTGASKAVLQQQNETSPAKNFSVSTSKVNQQREASARMIRSILSNKEARQSQLGASHSLQQIESSDLEDKRTTRAAAPRSISKDHFSSVSLGMCGPSCDMKRIPDDKVVGNVHHATGHINEKKEKRIRNKDRPDRGFWTPLRRSDGLHASDECLPSFSFQSAKLQSNSLEEKTIAQDVASSGVDVVEDMDSSNKPFIGEKHNHDMALNSALTGRGGMLSSTYDTALNHSEMKVDAPNAIRGGQIKSHGNSRINFSSMENGSHRHSRRGPSHGGKDVDSFMIPVEGKPSKRGGATGHGSHEKQVWVQKSGSGS